MDKPKGKLRILPDVSFRFVAPYSLDECSKRLMALDQRPKGLLAGTIDVFWGPFGMRVAVKTKRSGSCSFQVVRGVSAKGTLEMLGQNETLVEGNTGMNEAFGFVVTGLLMVVVAASLIVYGLASEGNLSDVELLILGLFVGPALIGWSIVASTRSRRDLRELIEATLCGRSATHNSDVTWRTDSH